MRRTLYLTAPSRFSNVNYGSMDKNYKDKLLEAMKASGEERKREEEARKFNGKGLFIAMIAIIAVVAVAALISKF